MMIIIIIGGFPPHHRPPPHMMGYRPYPGPHPPPPTQPVPAPPSRYPPKLHEMLVDLKPDGSGFMSNKEKEWVIKVQLLQLHNTSPDIEDYYYQVIIIIIIIIYFNYFFSRSVALRAEEVSRD